MWRMLPPHLRPFVTSMLASSILATAMLIGRATYAHQIVYIFFPFNLLLAWVPFWLAVLAAYRVRSAIAPRWKGGTWLVGWLLFFPNAPYLLTDFVHFTARPPIPAWYDIAMLSAFALTGLLLGLASLRLVHEAIAERTGRYVGWGFVWTVALLSGFGIYLGRYLRWNSWDVVVHPLALANDVFQRVAHPLNYPHAWGVTFVYGLFLGFIYFALRALTAVPLRSTSGPRA
ncbi:MAG: DUF1361 domain-containing protein [bacterium]